MYAVAVTSRTDSAEKLAPRGPVASTAATNKPSNNRLPPLRRPSTDLCLEQFATMLSPFTEHPQIFQMRLVGAAGMSSCPKIALDVGPDSRRGKGRIVLPCNPCGNTESGPKDKQDWKTIHFRGPWCPPRRRGASISDSRKTTAPRLRKPPEPGILPDPPMDRRRYRRQSHRLPPGLTVQ